MNTPIPIGNRRELFVDPLMVESLQGLIFKRHQPMPAPMASSPVTGVYMTILEDQGYYHAYYREQNPIGDVKIESGNPGEMVCYARSRDGHEWSFPSLGICEVNGSTANNVLLNTPPFCHNFSPFLDTNPTADPRARFKALSGTHPKSVIPGLGLFAFHSADGVHWEKSSEQPVLHIPKFGYDSQNISFWSPAEGCYVCYLRTWYTQHGKLRTISRSTSSDFQNWSTPEVMEANLPKEHLYTSQIVPYFRAPHIYIAFPTRYFEDRGSSTDVLFMATRAGSQRFDRLFTDAWIRPGPDPQRWGNRANYMACGITQTGPDELSIYHARSGRRFTLRPDGFVSIHAGSSSGELITPTLLREGSQLELNFDTSAAGAVKVELQDEAGRALPGYSLDDCDPLIGDDLARVVQWHGSPLINHPENQPLKIRLLMLEADLYSLRFFTPAP